MIGLMKVAQPASELKQTTRSAGLDRRSMVIGGLLLAGAAYSYLRKPVATSSQISQARFDAMIPAQAGPWQSYSSAELVLPPKDEASDKLYENLQTRVYRSEALPSIMALFGYSSVQQNDVHVHRPEVCYPAAGFPIIYNEPIKLKFGTHDVEARYLIADRQSVHEYILYWVRLGRRFPGNWQQQRLDMAYYNVTGTIPDGFLYRCSTIEQAGKDMREPLKGFAKTFFESADPSFRKIMV
jgi:EpsI family protein